MPDTLCRNPAEDGRTCDLCGGSEFTLLHQWPVGDRWNPASIPIAVWQCSGCSLVVLHPVPTTEQLPDGGDWWSPKRKRFRRRRWFKVRYEAFRGALFGTPFRRLVLATRKAVPRGRLLDVGCGRGLLLSEAAEFYDCVGLEPSGQAAAEVRRRGIEVIQSFFEDAPLEPESFDVIVMDSVIEHVASPVGVLRRVNTILRDGGVVVLKTPKFGGPAYRRHRAAWNGFRHGYHTYLFSGRTLGGCLEAAGFEVLRRPRRNRVLDDILILWGRKRGKATVD